MAKARKISKAELVEHFAERFDLTRSQAREFFDELTAVATRELKRSGEFTLPGMLKLVVRKRQARIGRNPATGEAIKVPAKTVVKARLVSSLKRERLFVSSGLEGESFPPRKRPKKR
jgi:DNA-binding protein HU-beta